MQRQSERKGKTDRICKKASSVALWLRISPLLTGTMIHYHRNSRMRTGLFTAFVKPCMKETKIINRQEMSTDESPIEANCPKFLRSPSKQEVRTCEFAVLFLSSCSNTSETRKPRRIPFF